PSWVHERGSPIRCVSLDSFLRELLEREPDNPYVAVFAPLIIDSDAELTQRAPEFWQIIQHAPLDAWTLDELIGHYVNYRKLRLNPEGERHRQDAFGLYAVATRCPSGLVRKHPLTPTAWDGVYDLPWGGHQVRLIVLNAIAKHP
ncbi:MAG: hypothetical protein VBE63_31170, partial [Lamprobacter sp.]|nr:hypothetical protein [Lamprobacter sp.]